MIESEREAFYGLLFSMSAVDGTMDKDEVELIYGSLNLEEVSEDSRRKIHGFVLDPPPFDDSVEQLSTSNETVRFGAMLHLIDIANADDIVEDSEQELLTKARMALNVNDEQYEALAEFSKVAKEVRDRGIDDEVGKDMLKRAAGGLTSVGVPIAAVYFSGSVIGLSAAGITSGLAALGLGLGMVPGIGVAVLLGAAVYFGATRLLDVGGKRKKAKAQEQKERRAQLVIANLQAAIGYLADRIEDLQKKAADAATNREAITELNRRLRTLKQLLARRQEAAA